MTRLLSFTIGRIHPTAEARVGARWTTRGALACALAIAALGCAPSGEMAPQAQRAPEVDRSRSVTVKGSDTLLVLTQRWAERYMTDNPAVTVQVTGGGSGTGIAALINGTTDIAASSRPIKDEERRSAESAGRTVREIAVCLDALSIVVHADNPVPALTVREIAGIYTGAISDWAAVGGASRRIVRYSRESSSGTYAFVKDEVLQGRDYAPDVQTMPGTSAVAEAVARDADGIGYGGVSYFATAGGLRLLPIEREDGAPAISPLGADGAVNTAAVYDGTYPLMRTLYFYVTGEPSRDAQAFIDFALGPAGQAIVSEVEYIPLPPAAGGATGS